MEQPKNVVFDVDPFLHLKPEEVLEPPVSVYVNEFCEESVKIFLEDMTKAQNTSQPIIPVYIDSYGGDVYALMAMIDIIKSSGFRLKEKIHLVSVGKEYQYLVLFTK